MTSSQAPAIGRWLLAFATILVLATVMAAINAMGTPAAQREVRLDDRRVEDLEKLAAAVDLYFEHQGRLPTGLQELAAKPGGHLPLADPVTGKRYGFAVTGLKRFRVCADFNTSTADTGSVRDGLQSEKWDHGRGNQCFDREVDSARN